MKNIKLSAADPFPEIVVAGIDGHQIQLGMPEKSTDWRMVVVYRGAHCPLCTRYLTELNDILPKLTENGIDLVAVSADPLEKAQRQLAEVNPHYPVGYGLTPTQMQSLGLYISEPRSPEETDRPFSEPGIFVINTDGDLQVVDISNTPFTRPNLESLAQGLGYIRNPQNDYPIRGTFDLAAKKRGKFYTTTILPTTK